MDKKTVGQIAYEAFGKAIPEQFYGDIPWDSLQEIVKHVWEKTGEAVENEIKEKCANSYVDKVFSTGSLREDDIEFLHTIAMVLEDHNDNELVDDLADIIQRIEKEKEG